MTNVSSTKTGFLQSVAVKRDGNGIRELFAATTTVDGVHTRIRRGGMGGPRYLRHYAETVFSQKAGYWHGFEMRDARDILLAIDGGRLNTLSFMSLDYRVAGEQATKVGEKPWSPVINEPFHEGARAAVERDWSKIAADACAMARVDLEEREELAEYWGAEGADPSNRNSTLALLAAAAHAERMFQINAHSEREFPARKFETLVSARYIRTLCLLHRCDVTKWQQEILWPEISELGRTILLLSCCGWLKEANELAHRAQHMILSHQNQFVPLVPWFGIVWGTQNPEILAKGAVSKFHRPTYDDVDWVLRNWRGDDLDGLAERLARIADRRRWMMGQFDDEYHIDFDDGFSWTIPYEVGAVLMARKAQGLPVPEIDHPIFALPTARFELAQGQVTHYQDIYARFIREA